MMMKKKKKKEHHFYATKSQYERRFKFWKWSKYQRKDEWQQISSIIQKRERKEKGTVVRKNGKVISADRVRKETLRYRLPRYREEPSPSLPRGFAISSPVLDHTVSWTTDLPFRNYEKCLEENRAWRDFSSHPGTIDPRLTSTVITGPDQQRPSISATFTPPTLFPHGNPERLKTLIKCLQATLPPEIAGAFTPRSVMDPTTRMFTSQFHRLVLYSLANNVDGDEYLSSDEVIRYVQQQTTQHPRYLIQGLNWIFPHRYRTCIISSCNQGRPCGDG